MTPIQLIVGLGNPGPEYQSTRHNVGAWFVQAIADNKQLNLQYESKFKGYYSNCRIADCDVRLLIPATYMNHSGESVSAFAKFYKIPSEAVLIVHDELDLAPGLIRLKFDGGHSGHNGLRNIMAHLHTQAFYRLRIGIGHPGQAAQVVNYVLTKPSSQENALIEDSINNALAHLADIISGNMQKAMKSLHTNGKVTDKK